MERIMEKKILVAFASKYGATAEIAERIGGVLQQNGLETDILPVKQVRDLSPYNVVILGSAIYYGRWRKDAVKFLKKNEKQLIEMAVWLFSSGPSGEGDPVELLQGWSFPTSQQAIADRIQPRSITLFHGALTQEKLSSFEVSILNKLEAPVGDFRDWDAITAWVESIAGALKETEKV
jgi:menaquinone-dependent protoporphyrinogen oxidase